MIADFFIVVRWWSVLFLFGAAAFPLTSLLFRGFSDQGYLFSKAVGLSVIGWLVFVFGMARLAPFTIYTIVVAAAIVFLVGAFFTLLNKTNKSHRANTSYLVKVIFFEELFFFAALLFWVWVKAHEPSIRGLEKFMDYGFMQSIVNSRYFPPTDMWYPPLPINYYYFGHLVTAMLSKASLLDLSYTFNLMLSTIFAFCFTMSFSIGYQLSVISHQTSDGLKAESRRLKAIIAGFFTAFLVTLSGNMQTIYAFTKGYTGDPPAGGVQPFWELLWPLKEFWASVGQGMETYWYANATRFIPFTIHEFPSYSFVVSDVHGHVLSIPFVLLAIGLLIEMFGKSSVVSCQTSDSLKTESWMLKASFYGFLCGILLMTNALDGPIYFGLLTAILILTNLTAQTGDKWQMANLKRLGITLGIVLVAAVVTSLPFLAHFTSFVNGIAVNCPPEFLANTKIGPLLFEGVEKCQRSPFWMMFLLWGFFWVTGGVWIVSKIRHIRQIKLIRSISPVEKLLMIFFFFSIALIIFPEFLYFKDIYPQHFRSNTMFKLGYDAFILFSIVSGYVLVSRVKNKLFIVLIVPMLFLVSIYPLFSVRSYFGGLKNYEGVYGLSWLEREYPDDFAGIEWLKKEVVSRQTSDIRQSDSWKLIAESSPILVEADGDSYTDYERFSTFTGIPTIVGWAVHEWLWRGSYDVVSPRREDVRLLYESTDEKETARILRMYTVQYVIVGAKEREKFINMHEEKFTQFGALVFESGDTRIYEINPEELSKFDY